MSKHPAMVGEIVSSMNPLAKLGISLKDQKLPPHSLCSQLPILVDWRIERIVLTVPIIREVSINPFERARADRDAVLTIAVPQPR